MRMDLLIKSLIPPIVKPYARKILKKEVWYGNFQSWEEAQKASLGYNAQNILNKVKEATQKVLNGEAIFERDSVLFREQEHNHGLLACLSYILAKEGELRVIDFGGALGSTFFQCKSWLSEFDNKVQWAIVEQTDFVTTGEEICNEIKNLYFDLSISEAKSRVLPNAILLSSVLQYLEAPYKLLESVLEDPTFRYVIIDRTPFVNYGNDILKVQRVPSWIYDASYPCWFFDKRNFLAKFEASFEMKTTFAAIDINPDFPSEFKGFFFERKT